MLLEFRVRNYRSFAGEAVFSMVAGKDQHLIEENTAETGIRALPRAVRSAAVYGANASGKSNLLKAMDYMRQVVRQSATLKPEQRFSVQPFRLDRESLVLPTLFEATVLIDGVRHQYGFEMTQEVITAEWLLVYKTARAQTWFDRRTVDGKTRYSFSEHLQGAKSTWEEATRSNALFLSTAVLLNSEQLRAIYQWFNESFVVLGGGGKLPIDFSTRFLEEPQGPHLVVDFLRSADFGICEARAIRREGFEHEFSFTPDGPTSGARRRQEFLLPQFTHEADGVRADFDFTDESEGTMKMFALAAPLLDIVANGKTLVVDELDNSLHPLLVRQIVKTFNDPRNVKGAQLIFTSHDTSLLDSGLMRRDQFWLVEKNRRQSSEVVPLTEFSPRKSEALERGYLSGRYGGIPVLSDRLVTGSRDDE
jgi:hypothetical protein